METRKFEYSVTFWGGEILLQLRIKTIYSRPSSFISVIIEKPMCFSLSTYIYPEILTICVAGGRGSQKLKLTSEEYGI